MLGGPPPAERRPRTPIDGERVLPRRGRRRVPPEMNDLAYLVNQVQERDPPIMRAHARFADDPRIQEPTVHVFDTDTGELVWRVTLPDLVRLAARFLRLNPGLTLSEEPRPHPGAELEPRPLPRPPGMNDLAYLANVVQRPRRPTLQAHAELVDGEPDEEPMVVVVDTAQDQVLLGLPLRDLLRLAAHLRLDSGLVFEAQG